MTRRVSISSVDHNFIYLIIYLVVYLNDDLSFFKRLQVFTGNSAQDTLKQITFATPFFARYVRLEPQAWQGSLSMQAEVYGCYDGKTGLTDV